MCGQQVLLPGLKHHLKVCVQLIKWQHRESLKLPPSTRRPLPVGPALPDIDILSREDKDVKLVAKYAKLAKKFYTDHMCPRCSACNLIFSDDVPLHKHPPPLR